MYVKGVTTFECFNRSKFRFYVHSRFGNGDNYGELQKRN